VKSSASAQCRVKFGKKRVHGPMVFIMNFAS
jgi:hypothetical protein